MLSVGQSFDWGNVLEGCNVELTPRSTVKVADISYQTSEPDVFAGGDIVTGPKFAIDAIASGKAAATSMHCYMRGRGLIVFRERDYKAINKDDADFSGFDSMPRQRPAYVEHKEAKSSFKDLRSNLTEEQLKIEAKRCLGCGITIVDPYMCIGCGVCATRCEFDAIKLERVNDAALVAESERAASVYVATAKRQAMLEELKKAKAEKQE